MPKSVFYICIISTIALCLASCNHKEAYYHFETIKDLKWSKLDTLYFKIDSTAINTQTIYDISIEISNNANYPYQNIWLFAQDNITDNAFTNYSGEYMLADKFGRWYGSGFGGQYQMELKYKDAVRFKEKRNYEIKVVHGMRDEPLIGIDRIGIKVKQAMQQNAK